MHPNNYNLSVIGRNKKNILKKVYKGKEKLDKMNFLDQISDPKALGRYKNFEGASSKVANYIRNLSKNI
jgi:hypothetical protein